MITTATEIKHVENSFEVLNSMEVDLEFILVNEFAQGLPNELETAN